MGRRFRVLASAPAALLVALAGCSAGRDFSMADYLGTFLARRSARTGPPPRTMHGPAPAALLADMDKPVGEGERAHPARPPIAPGREGIPPHWSTRRGPAYKDDWLRSFGRDAKELVPTLWDDTKATFTDPWALVGLGAAGVAGLAIHKGGADDSIEERCERRGNQLGKFGDMVGDIGGNPGLHFALAGAMYFGALASRDTKDYETSKALINALAINGLATMALKGIVHTESPNGDPWGWPSGHTSSTFCLATVLHEAYGPWVGVPLFLFAGYVGWERVEARNHDFSDVISGALIGIAIGHAVMKNHDARIFGFEVIPFADPGTGAVGLALAKRF